MDDRLKRRPSSRKSERQAARSGSKGFTIGRSGFAAISAVEGIRLSAEMQRDLRILDRDGVSSDERRRVIVSKYGKKPG
jgi:hypothetical protein